MKIPDIKIIQGDVFEKIGSIPDGSVHCIVTSPPYWNLRDYQTGTWEGGDAACEHKRLVGGECKNCGAKRSDKQLGQESTPQGYVDKIVSVMRGCRRTLHDSGVMFLNIGDSYSRSQEGSVQQTKNPECIPPASKVGSSDGLVGRAERPGTRNGGGLPAKNLCMIPFRVAIALQEDGWFVRSVIVWHKRAPMPESVTDRPTNAWEPIFLLSKKADYYYDSFAVREKTVTQDVIVRDRENTKMNATPGRSHMGGLTTNNYAFRNQRNVWTLSPEPCVEDHCAVFPSEIPRRAILAGTSAHGCCKQCLAPYQRIIHCPAPEPGIDTTPVMKGWEKTCDCDCSEIVPATVMDVFAGIGTTLSVAHELGRNAIGIELNPDYAQTICYRVMVTPELNFE